MCNDCFFSLSVIWKQNEKKSAFFTHFINFRTEIEKKPPFFLIFNILEWILRKNIFQDEATRWNF